MGESWTAIILEGAEDWIGVDLVACRSEEATAVVVTQVVAERSDLYLRC